MIRPQDFYNFLKEVDINFFAGVPDSQLKEFLDYLTDMIGVSSNHIITANEGNAVGLAAGYHLATGKIPFVYMQNSGLGNAVNPITSLTDNHVYGIPVLYMIGHRGFPGVHDEPQHVKQGAITIELLDLLGVKHFSIKKDTTLEEIKEVYLNTFIPAFEEGVSCAFVVQKGAFLKEVTSKPQNDYKLVREEVIQELIRAMNSSDVLVSTTGKISREVYEAREKFGQDHSRDFLTVGSMGHAGMISLGIANNTTHKVWCLDGDGAALMHLGSLPTIGANYPSNFVHVVLNNAAHESVGGQPTIANTLNLSEIAATSGYKYVYSVETESELKIVLNKLKEIKDLVFLEVKVEISSRDDLGRPKSSPQENKKAFMEFLK